MPKRKIHTGGLLYQLIISSAFPPRTSIDDSLAFMYETVLPNPEWPNIDKFAIMLPGKGEGEGEMGDKMVGFVGTNRVKEQGMEVGYCMNIQYVGVFLRLVIQGSH